MNTRIIKAVIPNNSTTSQELDFEGYLAQALDIPAGFDGTSITFTAASSMGGTHRAVYDDAGVAATAIVAENRLVSLPSLLTTLAPLQFVKLVCGTAQVGTAGAQTYPITTNAVLTVQGVRTYPITTNAVATDTITIGDVTLTAVEAEAGADEFIPGVDATATATAIKTALNANATISALYTATDSLGTITLTEKVAGGNTPPAATTTGTIVIGAGTVTNSKALPDTVTINGVTFTASDATQDATHFVVGAGVAATATNLKTALNANTTISALFTATDATGTVTLTEKVVGGLNNPTAATTTGTIVIGAGTATASVSGERIIYVSLKR